MSELGVNSDHGNVVPRGRSPVAVACMFDSVAQCQKKAVAIM